MTVTTTYQVEGMTCGHCVSSVTAEVGKVSGVSDVRVDLATKAVTVTSEGPVDEALIDAAVTEAGYELATVELLPQAGGSCCGSGGCS